MQSAPTWRRGGSASTAADPPRTGPWAGSILCSTAELAEAERGGRHTHVLQGGPLVKRDPSGGVCGGGGRPGTSRPGGPRWPPLWSCRAGGRSPHAGFPGCGFHVVRKLHPVISDLLGSFKSKRNYMLETCFSLVSSLENFVSLNFPAAF